MYFSRRFAVAFTTFGGNPRQIHWVKSPYSELFWSVFSCIWTEYGEIRSISSYSVRMRENTDQNNSEYGHLWRSLVNPIHHNPLKLKILSLPSFWFHLFHCKENISTTQLRKSKKIIKTKKTKQNKIHPSLSFFSLKILSAIVFLILELLVRLTFLPCYHS